MIPVENVYSFKMKLGIPPQLHSCHTGKIGKYYLEGHIPAADIKRLLKLKLDVKGLAVPGMPMGSPGMEGNYKDKYKVYSIDRDGTVKIFAEH
ncbi:MAG: hypothetical protein HOC24_11460 [Deltaproteobacteria bacterium]|jgi:hypothetical protein|nr:hypothetical protein [Deltaproteobacteria bacterium]